MSQLLSVRSPWPRPTIPVSPRTSGSASHPGASAAVQRGVQLERSGQFDEAEVLYRRAIRQDPNCIPGKLQLSWMLLARGEYGPALELLESRPAPQNPVPYWHGQNLNGKTVAVLAEAGLGDQIQFARWVPQLKARGAKRVIYSAPIPLGRLFAVNMPDVMVVGSNKNNSDTAYIVQLPYRPDFLARGLSLPYGFGARPHSIPPAPYLRAFPPDIERWRPRLPDAPLRVGLVWRGGPTNAEDKRRSLPGLATLAPLWQVPGVSFVSLQVGAGEDEARRGLPGMPLLHLGSDVKDFSDTAAILEQLALLISVDTSTAHLAGALGKPVWVLVDKTLDWRWRDADLSRRWYPTARVFHQHAVGEWGGAISDVATALMALSSTA